MSQAKYEISLNLVATQLGKQGLRALERRERFITELGIEVVDVRRTSRSNQEH